MTLLAIPSAISSAVSSLSHHGHKKGVQGSGSSTLNSTTSADAQDGSTQSLFGSLMDTAEQVIGIQTPTSPTPPTGAAAALTGVHAGKLSPAAMISAARSALQKA
jgi:hypothetical protein